MVPVSPGHRGRAGTREGALRVRRPLAEPMAARMLPACTLNGSAQRASGQGAVRGSSGLGVDVLRSPHGQGGHGGEPEGLEGCRLGAAQR